MPCPAVHATCTDPVAGCVKANGEVSAAPCVTAEAGVPLMRKSAASTPLTFSLKTTVMLVSVRTVDPAAGVRLATKGGMLSIRVYCHVAPGPVALKALG